MSATLIRCCNLVFVNRFNWISDTTTYADIRDRITSFEKVSKAWTSEQVLKHISEPPNYASTANDGPTPMEVDRVEKEKESRKARARAKVDQGQNGLDLGCFIEAVDEDAPTKERKGQIKRKSKGKKGAKGGGSAKGKKGGGRNKVAYGQCANCFEYGHWSRDCPHMVNQVVGKQEPIPPTQASTSSSSTMPAAKSSSSATVRRVFQFGAPLSNPSSPTSPRSPTSPQVRMVLFHDVENSWTELPGEASGDDIECEWVILDSGSDVSLLPFRFRADADSGASMAHGTLQNCQGGSIQTTGTKKADLIATTTDGEEVLLQHEFIISDVTSCLVSLGQLYQGGWTICKDELNDRLSLQSPGKEISIPVEYKNRSFAIKAHVRQVSDVLPGTVMAADDNDELMVRTVMYAEDEIDNAPMDTWEMTADGTPFMKTITTNFVGPEGVWPFWPYRTTLIRKFQKDRPWTVVELSRKFKDMRTLWDD